jgi:hypothetical protein
MEPDEVRTWLGRSPIRIRMNNGDTYDVARPEFALVGDYSIALLTHENGRMLNKLISLLNISEISESSQSAEKSR